MKTVTNNHADDSWGMKILRNMYPAGRSEFKDLPEGFADAVHVDVTLQFGVWDRLKLALGFDVSVRLVTWTENKPGLVSTDPPVVKVFWPWRLGKPPVGYVAAAEPGRAPLEDIDHG
jgi:hypothetical protein